MKHVLSWMVLSALVVMVPMDATPFAAGHKALNLAHKKKVEHKSSSSSESAHLHLPAQFDVVASGLYNPQGFTITCDGIYIAQCGLTLVPAPPPPGALTTTGRITKIHRDGNAEVVVDDLYGAQGAEGAEQENSGVVCVAWLDGSLYALTDWGPASGEFGFIPYGVSGVYQVDLETGDFTLVADLFAFDTANCSSLNPNCPPTTPLVDTFTSPFDMVAWNGKLYVSNGHTDAIDAVDPSLPVGSNIERFADFSGLIPDEPHLVLTGLGVSPYGHHLYVVQLTPFASDPQPPNSAIVWKIDTAGNITQVAQGYNYGQGVAVDVDGSIYVSQLCQTITNDGTYEGEGSLVRWNPKRRYFETIIENLTVPGPVRINGDYLYVSNYSQLGQFGEGQLVRINLKDYRIK